MNIHEATNIAKRYLNCRKQPSSYCDFKVRCSDCPYDHDESDLEKALEVFIDNYEDDMR